MKVILFSKDRPMQSHAYLESLFYFSDVKEEDVSVLYCHEQNILYDKVISAFPGVNWIQQTSFDKQLRELVNEIEDDYMMFGCDDVVFTKTFYTQDIEKLLNDYVNIFGFSLRLGTDILNFPEESDLLKRYEIEDSTQYWVWDWRSDKIDDFHYPWEMDCTVYRTLDVKSMINHCSEVIENPNYLEDLKMELPRWRMACYNLPSRAIVITVNRVQDTHPNEIDERYKTDVESLNQLYNNKGYKLDIKEIAQKYHNMVHVNADYFILYPQYDLRSNNG